jgi:hypothetical protein
MNPGLITGLSDTTPGRSGVGDMNPGVTTGLGDSTLGRGGVGDKTPGMTTSTGDTNPGTTTIIGDMNGGLTTHTGDTTPGTSGGGGSSNRSSNSSGSSGGGSSGDGGLSGGIGGGLGGALSGGSGGGGNGGLGGSSSNNGGVGDGSSNGSTFVMPGWGGDGGAASGSPHGWPGIPASKTGGACLPRVVQGNGQVIVNDALRAPSGCIRIPSYGSYPAVSPWLAIPDGSPASAGGWNPTPITLGAGAPIASLAAEPSSLGTAAKWAAFGLGAWAGWKLIARQSRK